MFPEPTTLADLARRARGLVAPDRRTILGIAGAPGSGKSTLAAALLAELRGGPAPLDTDGHWVAHVPMDGFHLADVELDRLGLLHRKGAPETFDVAGYVNTLGRLCRQLDGIVYAPDFDRRLEQPVAGAIAVEASVRLVVTEGNYLLHDVGEWARVRQHLDEVWFVEADETERRRHLVARHVAYGKTPQQAQEWVAASDDPNAELVARTRRRADLVVPAVRCR